MKLRSVLHLAVGDFGLQADSLTLLSTDNPINNLATSDVRVTIKNAYSDLSKQCPVTEPEQITVSDTAIKISFSFLMDKNQIIQVSIKDVFTEYTKDTVDKSIIQDLDTFHTVQREHLLYRMYVPHCESHRPLIVFLHGGGECGSDNELPLTGTMGAIALARRYPDFYVMAPQAPDNGIPITEALKSMNGFSDFDSMDLGRCSVYTRDSRGWNRDYLSLLSAEVRRLVSLGKVDPRRIYLTGMSMGGGGCIQLLSVDPSLFAAACVICPSMNSDTYTSLYELPPVPCWISTAYIDHQKNRHVFLLNACSHLWEQGRKDVKLTLFTASELKKYKIGHTPGLTDAQVRFENHNCWTLVYHNEHAMLSWMVSQINKNPIEQR